MLVLALLVAASLAQVPAQPVELTVLAASSLRQPLEAAGAGFEHGHPGIHVRISAAATGVIAQQLEQGAPADVFIGAAREPSASFATRGLVETPVVIARNHLVVAVPASGTLHPASLSDLASPAYRHIGIGSPRTVPAGAYAVQVLIGAHLEGRLSAKFTYGQSVAQVTTMLTAGAVEAGFVYQSDVAGTGGALIVGLALDDASHDPIVYPASVVKASTHPEAAREWVAFLQGAEGQKFLAHAGFEVGSSPGFEVAGAIPRPGRITQSDLDALSPIKAQFHDHRGDHEVLGVPLDVVLAHLGFDPGPMGPQVPKGEKRSGYKKVVVATAADGFQAVFSCAELVEAMGGTRALVIWQLDGQPLASGQGPYRLAVTTDKEPSRSLYSLQRLDVVDMREVVPPRAK